MKQTIVMLLANPFRPDPRVLKEAKSLVEAGFDLTIIAWDRLGEYSPIEKLQENLQILRIQNARSEFGLGIRQTSRILKFWGSALPHIQKLHPAFIHCHDFDTLPVGVWYGWLHRIPVIYDAHEYYAELVKPRLSGIVGDLVYLSIRILESLFVRMVNAVVTVDENLAQRYRIHNNKVLIIGHYPSTHFVTTTRKVLDDATVKLIYSGRLSQDRGIGTYLDIVKLLCDMNIPVHLSLAGSFLPKEEINYFNQDLLGIENFVSLKDWISYSEMPNLLLGADIGLAIYQPVPRYVAALPVKIFEYMAAGIPFIASDFPMIRDVVNANQCGALVPPGDAREAAKIIQGWWENPQQARDLGRNGREAILTRYNWEMLAEQLIDLYRSL